MSLTFFATRRDLRRRLLSGSCALALGAALTGAATVPATAGVHHIARLHSPHPLVPRPRGGRAQAITGAVTSHGGTASGSPSSTCAVYSPCTRRAAAIS